MKTKCVLVMLVALMATLPAVVNAQAPAPESSKSKQASAADNSKWQYQFGFPGSEYKITALGASRKNVYASLDPIGPNEVGKMFVQGKVAYWDGGAWHTMGNGTNEPPNDYRAIGDNVYVCGQFDRADDKSIAGIARWNETTLTLSAVGSGVGPRAPGSGGASLVSCNAVTAIGNDVYIGGYFEKVDGAEIYNVAKWDGAKWSQVGYGVYYAPKDVLGSVFALAALPDGKLVVGGNFTHVYVNDFDTSKTPMSNIAIWDPVAKKFLSMGSGLSAPPNEIIVAGNDVYAGGDFKTAGGVAVNGIARWDGAKWNALGTGLGNGRVTSMAWRDGKLYIGGSFGNVGGVNAHRIARWDGAAWAGLDATDSTEDDVNGVAITDDGDVYVAGKFSLLSGLRAHNIARWREADQRWRTLGFGPVDGGGTWAANISAVYTLPDGKILVSGDFGRAAGKLANRLAIWDPINKEWAEWQGGANGSVFAIERNGDLLYFGGAFSQIGGISAPGIATYNLKTGQWASLGTGLDYPVNAIAFAPDGLVYIGGSFTATPNGPALLLALYNPATQTWSSTPLGFDPRSGYEAYVYAPFVASLVADSEGVLIGGWFRLRKINGALVQGTTPVGLIYWNRKTGAVSRFDDGPRLGGDSEGSINTIVPMPDGSFYVGGRFTKIGSGVAANNAARYSAAGWQPLGTGVRSADSYGPDVQVMRRNGDRLFVGGDFATAGNTTSENAAVWNIATGQWEALGDGVYGADFESRRGVKAIAFDSNAAYFGGHFWFAGAGQASGFAAWNFTSTQLPNQPPTQGPLDKKVFLPSVVR